MPQVTQNYMSAVTTAPGQDKALPDIPIDIDIGGAMAEGEVVQPVPPLKNTIAANKALPSIRVEKTLSQEEMSRSHELWNEAGLSARAHRRRRRDQYPNPRRIPAPISIPEPEDDLPTLSPAGSSVTSTTPPTTGTRKRWGSLSARLFRETRQAEKRIPNTLGALRAMAQNRLKKKLRYAKSAPNLGDQAAPVERGLVLEPIVPMPVETPPKDAETEGPRAPSPLGESEIPEAVLPPEDMDQNAIYFTIDANWHISAESVEFQFITPIPHSSSVMGRPDSPLLHRNFSLDQLAFAAQEAITASTTTEYPEEASSSDEVLHLTDELQTYLEC